MKLKAADILPISNDDRARWAQHFACQSPERIQIERSYVFQCHGCSGSCGTSHFVIAPHLQQVELFANA